MGPPAIRQGGDEASAEEDADPDVGSVDAVGLVVGYFSEEDGPGEEKEGESDGSGRAFGQ